MKYFACNKEMHEWVVKIVRCNQGQENGVEFLGMGFFVGNHNIITCKHLFETNNSMRQILIDTDDKDIFNSHLNDVEIEFKNKTRCKITCFDIAKKGLDLIILNISKDLTCPAPTIMVIDKNELEKTKTKKEVIGYDSHSEKWCIEFLSSIIKTTTDEANGYLKGAQMFGAPPAGMSGAPVIIKKGRKEYVIGIMTHGGEGKATSIYTSSDEILGYCRTLNIDIKSKHFHSIQKTIFLIILAIFVIAISILFTNRSIFVPSKQPIPPVTHVASDIPAKPDKIIVQNIVPKIQISSPTREDSIGTRITVSGTVIPKNALVSVLVRPNNLSQYMCQGVSKSNNNEWSIPARIGEFNQHKGEKYDIIAITTKYPIKKGEVFDELPPYTSKESVTIIKTKQ